MQDLHIAEEFGGTVLGRIIRSFCIGADAETARNLKPDTRAIESFTGLVFAPDGTRLYMSNVLGSVKVFAVRDGTVAASHAIPLPPAAAPKRKEETPAGLAVSADGGGAAQQCALIEKPFRQQTMTI